MEVLEIVFILVVLAAGYIIGYEVGVHMTKKNTRQNAMGRLRIDHSEPDEPTRMFVELKGVTPDMIAQHDVVVFEVINESYIPSQN